MAVKTQIGWYNWVFWGVVILFILLVVVGIIIYVRRDNSSSPTSSDFATNNPLTWGPATAVTTARGSCSLYVYPGVLVDVQGNQLFQPPTPSASLSLVNSLTSSSDLVPCIDVDQNILALYQHTCLGTAGQTSLCIQTDGSSAAVGTTEQFYSSENCASPGVCYGTLGTFGVNFSGNPPSGLCARVDNSNNLKVKSCDPAEPSQIFRISRVNPGVTPPISFNPSQPQTSSGGLLGQFLYRPTGQCAVPVTNTPNSLITLGTCTNPYPWALISEFVNGNNKVAPQQIAYIGSLSIPQTTDGDLLAAWLVENQIQSLSFNGDDLILAPFVLDGTTSEGAKQTANYIPFTSFSSNINVPVCFNNLYSTCSTFGTQTIQQP